MADLQTDEKLDQYSSTFIEPVILTILNGNGASNVLKTFGVPIVGLAVDGAGGAYNIFFQVQYHPNSLLIDLKDSSGSLITIPVAVDGEAYQLDPNLLLGWEFIRLHTSIPVTADVNFELHFRMRT